MSLFTIGLPSVDWDIPTEFPSLSGVVGLDLETRDPSIGAGLGAGWAFKGRKYGYIIGISIAMENGFKAYYPIEHAQGRNLDSNKVLGWLREELSKPDITIVGHNLIYDIGWLRKHGVEVKCKIACTQIMGALINENRFQYGLDILAEEYLNEKKDESLMREAAEYFGFIKYNDPDSKVKEVMWKLPPEYVGIYAEKDAWLTLRLFKKFYPIILEESLLDVYRVEMDYIRVLLDMRTKGVRVDVDKAEQNLKQVKQDKKLVLDKIKDLTGRTININASESIAPAWEELYGNDYELTDNTGKPSFTKEFMLNHPGELGKLIVDAKELDKIAGTFLEGYILNHAVDGRVHGEFNQLKSDEGGTVTGRLSSKNPNMQNISARDLRACNYVRGCFLPELNEKWVCIDYSAQEIILQMHFAYACYLIGTRDYKKRFKGIQTIIDMLNEHNFDFHQHAANMMGIPDQRKRAKRINLGLTYGMGIVKLADQLGLSEYEAQILKDKYFKEFPFIQNLIKESGNIASERGYVRTLLGRRGRFDRWEPNKFDHGCLDRSYEQALVLWGTDIKRAHTYKALNKIIQGSAADQTKVAGVLLWKEGPEYLPLLQVHDEYDFSMPEDPIIINRARQIMIDAVKLHVPVRCDIEIGPNWAEIGEYIT